MTMLNTLRSAMNKRTQYLRTRRELQSLPADLALEDLGIYPGDADQIARKAVYG